MAYTLKSTGIATNLTMCLMVDEDGTTIKEFVNATVNSQKTVDSGVTISEESWKGTTRKFFATAANGTFDFHGIRFGATKPAWNPTDADGCAFWGACASMSAGISPGVFLTGNIAAHHLRRKPSAPNSAQLYSYDGNRGAGSTALPVTGESFSFGCSYDSDDFQWYYGLESGSLAADGSGTSNNGWMESTTVAAIGGWSGQNNLPASWHICCIFNRKLTLTEMQSLHNDWFGTLFESAAAPKSFLPNPIARMLPLLVR